MSDSVRVAVRVRPFNQREKDMNATLCIAMAGAQTRITNPETGDDKPFTFDYSYQSHNGFMEDPDQAGYNIAEPGSNYASQKQVFDTMGQDVLDNAYKGFNTSLFAYGQTGSGKSYSMVGYGVNKGIVPMSCDAIFATVRANDEPGKSYRVTLQMLEIYNEQVRDLLSKVPSPKGGLKVRQHPKLGVQVVGLEEVPVGSFEEINDRIEGGTSNRTVAATKMNATSSRAHTVVTIMFTQITKDGKGPGKDKEMTAKINLVDLAGSERASSTGATGDTLKEGSAINLSLTMLGNVIKALADKSNNPKSKILIPYRDSKLTQILQDALGGNSKTIMIAALSPASVNYEETLSTLRYADRAKQIKNKAVVNIDPQEAMILALKEENAKLMNALKAGGGSLDALNAPTGATEEEIEEMKKKMREEMEEEMRENMRLLEQNSMNFDDRLAATRSEHAEEDAAAAEARNKKNTVNHIANLNEDPALSNMVVKFLEQPSVTVGRKDADPEPTIVLGGLSIQKQHCTFAVGDDKIEVTAHDGAKVLVNGVALEAGKGQELHHNDRVLFGNNHMYLCVFPKERDAAKESGTEFPDVDWELAQKEIASANGVDTNSKPMALMTNEEIQKKIVQDDLVQIMPLVTEANALSEELDKAKQFEVKLWARDGKTEVGVKVVDLITDNSWMWPREKFVERTYLMREMYANFMEYGPDGIKENVGEKDPFFENDSEVLIGTSYIQLNSLAYLIENEDLISITSVVGKPEGQLRVEIEPCDQSGNVDEFDDFVEDPKELIGKRLDFVVRIPFARGLPARYKKGSFCQFRFHDQEKVHKTKVVENTTNPDYGFEVQITVETVTESVLEHLEGAAIAIEIYGQQDEAPASEKAARAQYSTKQLLEKRGSSADLSLAGKKASNEAMYLEAELQKARQQITQQDLDVQMIERRLERRTRQINEVDKVLTEGEAAGKIDAEFAAKMRTVLQAGSSAPLRAMISLKNKAARIVAKRK